MSSVSAAASASAGLQHRVDIASASADQQHRIDIASASAGPQHRIDIAAAAADRHNRESPPLFEPLPEHLSLKREDVDLLKNEWHRSTTVINGTFQGIDDMLKGRKMVDLQEISSSLNTLRLQKGRLLVIYNAVRDVLEAPPKKCCSYTLIDVKKQLFRGVWWLSTATGVGTAIGSQISTSSVPLVSQRKLGWIALGFFAASGVVTQFKENLLTSIAADETLRTDLIELKGQATSFVVLDTYIRQTQIQCRSPQFRSANPIPLTFTNSLLLPPTQTSSSLPSNNLSSSSSASDSSSATVSAAPRAAAAIPPSIQSIASHSETLSAARPRAAAAIPPSIPLTASHSENLSAAGPRFAATIPPSIPLTSSHSENLSAARPRALVAIPTSAKLTSKHLVPESSTLRRRDRAERRERSNQFEYRLLEALHNAVQESMSMPMFPIPESDTNISTAPTSEVLSASMIPAIRSTPIRPSQALFPRQGGELRNLSSAHFPRYGSETHLPVDSQTSGTQQESRSESRQEEKHMEVSAGTHQSPPLHHATLLDHLDTTVPSRTPSQKTATPESQISV